MEKILGKLEKSILETLWERDGICGREIYQKISKNKEIAYTTVLTVLDRMVKKGIVDRKKVDNIYLYYPSMKKEEFERFVTSNIIKGIFDIAPSQAISTFADILSEMNESEINKFFKLIEEKRKAENQ
ncbi:MAG: BlaI/MecI/CopY family transcriptional regulator [Acidobacteriota bacterium]